MIKRVLLLVKEQHRPFRFLLTRILWRSGILGMISIRYRKDTYRLRMFPSMLSTQLWIDKSDRRNDTAILKSLLRSGDRYLDIGANIGHLTIEARLIVGSTGAVTALEAHPRIAGYLRENLKLNGLSDVHVANVAIGETVGWIQFSDARSDDQNVVSKFGKIKIPCFTIDTLQLAKPLTLMKIDVEGYEKFVLSGAISTLESTDFVYFEAWSEHFEKFGYSFEEVYDILAKSGFEIARPGAGKIKLVSRNEKIPSCVNLLAFRSREKLIERTGWEISD